MSYNLFTQLNKEENNEIIKILFDIINELFNFNNSMDIDIASVNDEDCELDFVENIKDESDSNLYLKENMKREFEFNENNFENIKRKKNIKVKYDKNDFNKIYDLKDDIEEELIEKKRKKYLMK